jgi:hypothetical protein
MHGRRDTHPIKGPGLTGDDRPVPSLIRTHGSLVGHKTVNKIVLKWS